MFWFLENTKKVLTTREEIIFLFFQHFIMQTKFQSKTSLVLK